MNIKSASLSTRLLLASSILLPVLLGVSAYMLDLAFQRSLYAAQQQRLQGHLYLLLAAAEVIDDQLQLPTELIEPRFSQLDSGLYAHIYDVDGREVWRSASAEFLPELKWSGEELKPGTTQFSRKDINSGDYSDFFQLIYDVAWEGDDGRLTLFRFDILYSQLEYKSELAAYRQQLWWYLGGLALLLLITQMLILRWGLKPLQVLAHDLDAIDAGEAATLAGEYPAEIHAVTENLNRVLKTERAQRERYKNTLSDLAHSLKTPLAVVRGANGLPMDKLRKTLDEQITRMNQIVSHQLQRAVISNQQTGIKVNISNIIKRLSDALGKVYKEKNIDFNLIAQDEGFFYGDESDLMELLGNVLDNAYKYGQSKIAVGLSTNSNAAEITVADDGAGISDEMCQDILQRGTRADSTAPGQGIGLAVAVDIVNSYGGDIAISRSKFGGAEFKITLPYANHTGGASS